MPTRTTTMQRVALVMFFAGIVLTIVSVAAVMGQISQMVPYTDTPPPDSTLYLRMLYFGWVLIGGAMAIVLSQAWRTKGLAGMWNTIAPKTRIQKFGCGLFLVGLVAATLNIRDSNSFYGLIVMAVGLNLW